MTTDLPDLDEAISFAVDDGAQAGPFTMNQIIDSVRSGERAPNTLVWWAGQPDWVAFDAVPELLAQVEVAEEPAEEPAAPEEDTADSSGPVEEDAQGEQDAQGEEDAQGEQEAQDVEGDQVDTETSGLGDAAAVASMAPAGESVDPFADVEDYVFSDQPDEVTEPAATITESLEATDSDTAGDAWVDTTSADAELGDTGLVDGDLIDDVDAAAEGWGVAAEENVDVVEDLADTAASDDADVDDGAFGAPVGELTEEFGGSGLFGGGPTEAVAEETPSSLQSVSERIEALGSEAPAAAIGGLFGSTRRAASDEDASADAGDDSDSDEDDAAVEEVAQLVDTGETEQVDAAVEPSFAEPEFDEPIFDEPDFEVHEAFDSGSTETSADDGFDELDQIVEEIQIAGDGGLGDGVDEETVQDDAIEEVAAIAESNPELEALFAEMVENSGSRHQRFDWASKLDDVSVGAIIASTLGKGFSLVDLHSLGQSHQARFENGESGERLIVELDSLGPAAAGGELLNQHAYVTVGLGRPVSADEIVGDDFAADTPGTITVEVDMESGYAFSTVDLIWEFNELLGADRSIDSSAVNQRIDAAMHALRGHWNERFGQK